MRRVNWVIGILGVAAVVGCGVDDSESPLLTRRDAEPPGEHCKLGGTAISAGLDRNLDTVL